MRNNIIMAKQLTDNQIRMCIRGCGWKQKAIAEESFCSPYHLSRIINGKDITPKMRFILLKFIEKNVSSPQQVIKKEQEKLLLLEN